jgi:hypothetical protein
VCDYIHHAIRAITPEGVVSTFARGRSGYMDGSLSEALFNGPVGITIDQENNLFVTENLGHQIRMISVNGMVSTVAGNGVQGFADGDGSIAMFSHPTGIIWYQDSLYIADRYNNRIRKVSQNQVSTLTGSSNDNLSQPVFLALHKDVIYISDLLHNQIKSIQFGSGDVQSIAGSGVKGNRNGPNNEATFNSPFGIVTDKLGNLYVVDRDNYLIRKITI